MHSVRTRIVLNGLRNSLSTDLALGQDGARRQDAELMAARVAVDAANALLKAGDREIKSARESVSAARTRESKAIETERGAFTGTGGDRDSGAAACAGQAAIDTKAVLTNPRGQQRKATSLIAPRHHLFLLGTL